MSIASHIFFCLCTSLFWYACPLSSACAYSAACCSALSRQFPIGHLSAAPCVELPKALVWLQLRLCTPAAKRKREMGFHLFRSLFRVREDYFLALSSLGRAASRLSPGAANTLGVPRLRNSYNFTLVSHAPVLRGALGARCCSGPAKGVHAAHLLAAHYILCEVRKEENKYIALSHACCCVWGSACAVEEHLGGVCNETIGHMHCGARGYEPLLCTNGAVMQRGDCTCLCLLAKRAQSLLRPSCTELV